MPKKTSTNATGIALITSSCVNILNIYASNVYAGRTDLAVVRDCLLIVCAVGARRSVGVLSPVTSADRHQPKSHSGVSDRPTPQANRK